MYAYEIRARIDAGLTLVGREDGEYLWIGTASQWNEVPALENRDLHYDIA